MQGLLSPRRVLTALSILVVLWVAGVATAGVDQSVEGTGGPLPDSFRLAEERVGDAAQYDFALVRVSGDSAQVLEEHEVLGLEWMPPQPTHADDGRVFDTNRLHEWGWQQDDDGRWEMYAQPVWAIDRSTRAVVAYSYMHDSDLQPTGSSETFYVGDARYVPPCGAGNQYAGRDVPLDRPVVFYAACGWPNYWSPSEELKAVATQRLGDSETILFTTVPQGWPASHSGSSIHVWFQEDIPFPVRIASQDQDDRGLWHVYRMTRFQRGTEPITWAGQGPLPDTAPLAFAPRQGGLIPDEAGITHPFPLSAALAASRGASEAADFWAVLDSGGYIGVAQSFAEPGTDPAFHWSLVATDGQRQALIEVRQTTEPSSTPALLWGVAPAARDIGRETRVTVTPGEGEYANFPAPALVRPDFPTVSSLWTRWRSFASEPYRDLGADAWGFWIRCGGPGCTQASHQFSAGVFRSEEWHEPPTPPKLVGDSHGGSWQSLLRIDINLLHGNHSYLQESRSSADAEEKQVSSMGAFEAAQLRSSQEIQTFSALAWVQPAAPWVAGTGALALLASLAYLLWPLGKSGAFALFSRVRPHDVVRHPVRARILHLVGAQPGIHMRDLARRLELGRHQAEHHLRKLDDAGLLRVVAGSGYTCLFLRGSLDAPVMDATAMLKAPAAKAVLGLALRSPGVGVREAAGLLALSPGTVAYHLRRLRAAGLLEPTGGLLSTGLGRRAAAVA